MLELPLSNSPLKTLIDDASLALVESFGSLSLTVSGYVQGKDGLLSRFLLGLSAGDKRHAEHAGGNRLDNRLSASLRISTASQNNANRKKYLLTGGVHSSTFKGVERQNIGRPKPLFGAKITQNGVRVYLGSFADAISAAKAYDSAAAHFQGAYAKLNFPEERPAPYVPYKRKYRRKQPELFCA